MPTSTAQLQNLAQAAGSIYISYLGLFEFLGIVITIILAIRIAILIEKTHWLRDRIERMRSAIRTSDPVKKKAKQSWNDVQKHFFSGSDNDLRVAIIEADKMLDEALRNAGFMGNNLGDRLKRVKASDLTSIEEIWQAHKLRNQIAHEGDHTLDRTTAQKALGIYEQALEKLGALERKDRPGTEGNSRNEPKEREKH